MADFVFHYGAMGCSKTANALMTRFQHVERDRKVWLIKPATDTREKPEYLDGKPIKTLVKSRIGIEAWSDIIRDTDKIIPPEGTQLIICDEAQFLTPKQVEELKVLTEYNNIAVYCYGLRTDFRGELFPGSKRLFELATNLVELDSVCDCGNRAIISARILNNKVVTEGEVVEIGGDERYKAMCYRCWKETSGKE